jgi:hypothetical protein
VSSAHMIHLPGGDRCVLSLGNMPLFVQEAGCASAGRIREVLPLAGPPTLAAWLAARRPQMLQRYCLARLAKARRCLEIAAASLLLQHSHVCRQLGWTE